MRVSGLLALVLVGCGVEADTMFTHEGQVMAQAQGLVVSADGTEAMAGMYGTTCVFAQNGRMGLDYDLDGDDEVIEDSNSFGDVLVRSDGGIHEISPYGGSYSDSEQAPTWQTNSGNDEAFETTELQGVIAARWAGDVPVVLLSNGGDCFLQSLGAAPFTVALEPSVCAEYSDMAVTSAGVVFIGTTNEVISITGSTPASWMPDGVTGITMDESLQLLYVLTDGGRLLQALEMDGQLRWQQGASEFTALTHMGPRGAVTVTGHDGAGRGILAVYDGSTGALEELTDTPTAGLDLAISENGTTLAIAADQFIHLFAVDQ